jgi:hypothetical protein
MLILPTRIAMDGVVLIKPNGPQQRHRATGVKWKQDGLAGSAGCGG